MDTRQQRKRMSSENRGQTGLGYVESRLRKTIVKGQKNNEHELNE